ncbi:MAG: DUF4296 domain-containing protein [Bacteroidia bacterium]
MIKLFKTTVCVLVICLNTNCNNKSEITTQPQNLIDKETMAKIVADIHVADAGVTRQFLTPDSSEKLAKTYYAIIAKSYNIDFNTINNSFEYYLSEPALMDSIYTKAIEILNTHEATERGRFLKNQQITDTSNITKPIQVNP